MYFKITSPALTESELCFSSPLVICFCCQRKIKLIWKRVLFLFLLLCNDRGVFCYLMISLCRRRRVYVCEQSHDRKWLIQRCLCCRKALCISSSWDKTLHTFTRLYMDTFLACEHRKCSKIKNKKWFLKVLISCYIPHCMPHYSSFTNCTITWHQCPTFSLHPDIFKIKVTAEASHLWKKNILTCQENSKSSEQGTHRSGKLFWRYTKDLKCLLQFLFTDWTLKKKNANKVW